MASSLLTLLSGAQASGLGARMERVMAAPPPERASRTRRLSGEDIGAGLKGALMDGASLAVLELGAPGGFGEPSIYRIEPLQIHDRHDHLARAAERTASQAGPILREAINALYFPDPQALLDADSSAATNFLRDHAAEHLRSELTPVARHAYAAAAIPGRYGAMPSPRIADHIAHGTVDALFQAIGRQEQLIRRVPSARGTPHLARVFGATT
ncbi:MAG: DUF4197 family protein [Salinisphaera sp.]